MTMPRPDRGAIISGSRRSSPASPVSLALALRSNRAQVRYWLWLAASMKFLVPFAALVALGGQFGWRVVRPRFRSPNWLVVDGRGEPAVLRAGFAP